jgi:uncharacterized membrane protein YvlD (DUF360 family)
VPTLRSMNEIRKVERVVTRVNPRSMLKFSLFYAFSLWLILVVAGVLLWLVASVAGTTGKIEDFLAELLAERSFSINGVSLLIGSAVLGLTLLVAAAVFSAVTSMLFNVISGVTGGLRFTILEPDFSESEGLGRAQEFPRFSPANAVLYGDEPTTGL